MNKTQLWNAFFPSGDFRPKGDRYGTDPRDVGKSLREDTK